MTLLRGYAPAITLGVWAVLWTIGARGPAVTGCFLAVLSVTVALNIYDTQRRFRRE